MCFIFDKVSHSSRCKFFIIFNVSGFLTKTFFDIFLTFDFQICHGTCKVKNTNNKNIEKKRREGKLKKRIEKQKYREKKLKEN